LKIRFWDFRVKGLGLMVWGLELGFVINDVG
jgi:hypothetical protein